MVCERVGVNGWGKRCGVGGTWVKESCINTCIHVQEDHKFDHQLREGMCLFGCFM